MAALWEDVANLLLPEGKKVPSRELILGSTVAWLTDGGWSDIRDNYDWTNLGNDKGPLMEFTGNSRFLLDNGSALGGTGVFKLLSFDNIETDIRNVTGWLYDWRTIHIPSWKNGLGDNLSGATADALDDKLDELARSFYRLELSLCTPTLAADQIKAARDNAATAVSTLATAFDKWFNGPNSMPANIMYTLRQQVGYTGTYDAALKANIVKAAKDIWRKAVEADLDPAAMSAQGILQGTYTELENRARRETTVFSLGGGANDPSGKGPGGGDGDKGPGDKGPGDKGPGGGTGDGGGGGGGTGGGGGGTGGGGGGIGGGGGGTGQQQYKQEQKKLADEQKKIADQQRNLANQRVEAQKRLEQERQRQLAALRAEQERQQAALRAERNKAIAEQQRRQKELERAAEQQRKQLEQQRKDALEQLRKNQRNIPTPKTSTGPGPGAAPPGSNGLNGINGTGNRPNTSGGPGGAAAAANGRGNGGVPLYPPTAGAGGGMGGDRQNNERERTTWVAEDKSTWKGREGSPSTIGRKARRKRSTGAEYEYVPGAASTGARATDSADREDAADERGAPGQHEVRHGKEQNAHGNG